MAKRRNFVEKTFSPWCQYPAAHRDHTVSHWLLQGIFWGLFKLSQQHPGDLFNCKGSLFLQVPNLQPRLIHLVTCSQNTCVHHTQQYKQQSIPYRWSLAKLSMPLIFSSTQLYYFEEGSKLVGLHPQKALIFIINFSCLM